MLSREGREYRKRVANEVTLQRVPRYQLTGKLAVHITAHCPDRRARDLDNLVKAVADGLQHTQVFVTDSDIDDLHVVRGPVLPGGLLRLTINEIANEATKSEELFAEATL